MHENLNKMDWDFSSPSNKVKKCSPESQGCYEPRSLRSPVRLFVMLVCRIHRYDTNEENYEKFDRIELDEFGLKR